jgi:hypothetical protein
MKESDSSLNKFKLQQLVKQLKAIIMVYSSDIKFISPLENIFFQFMIKKSAFEIKDKKS